MMMMQLMHCLTQIGTANDDGLDADDVEEADDDDEYDDDFNDGKKDDDDEQHDDDDAVNALLDTDWNC